MTQKIKFTALDPYGWEVAPRPFPASQAIPQWWKDEPPYEFGEKIQVKNFTSNATFKKCTPMLDTLTSGYLIPLWADVYVTQVETGPRLTWRTSNPVFSAHGTSAMRVEVPDGFSSSVFKFANLWVPRTPKGYSVLVTAPFGYRKLPMQAIPAIVDSDVSVHDLTVPMWIKEGFEGVVPKGTPLVQVTPFKRVDWEAEFDYFEAGKHDALMDKTVSSTIVNNYVKHVHSKKKYR